MPIIIAIDGYSSCGKSTLAKQLAKLLNYVYIDTGALYRVATWYGLNKGYITPNDIDIKSLVKDLPTLNIHFVLNKETGNSEIAINNQVLEKEIRTLEVANKVSTISSYKEIRDYMVDLQRQYGIHKSVVLDGRDIGTNVFPNAELKIFMTADVDIRAQRRLLELNASHQTYTLEEIKKNLEKRDNDDLNRIHNPLKQAPDAVVIDNSNISVEDTIQQVYQLAVKKINVTV